MRTFTTRILLALVLASVLLPACSKPTADEHFRNANEHWDKGRISEAIVGYRMALAADPTRGDIRVRLADAYVRSGDLRGAFRETINAADQLPNDAALQVRAGTLLMAAGSMEDAKARAKKALALDAKNADAMILLGNALLGLKDITGAMNEYQEAIALAPDRDPAYANIGSIQMLRGKPDEAEASFKKAVQVAPKSVPARLALAHFFWVSGRTPDAEQTLKDALAIDPTNLPANRALGLLYIDTKRAKNAEPYFQAIAQSAKSPDAILSLADYYIMGNREADARKVLVDLATMPGGYELATTRLAALDAAAGRKDDALAKVDSVLAKRPTEMPARLLKAKVLLADGQQDGALAVATSIVRDEPTSRSAGDAYVLIGNIQTATDHPEDAIKAFEEALKRQAHSIAANVGLAAVYLAAGSVDKAETYTEQALAIQPSSAQALIMRVRVFLAQGNLPKAKAVLESLRKAFPDSPTVLNLMGAHQLASRQVEAARASYSKAVSLAPTDLEALTGLVTIDLAAGRAKDAVSRIEAGLRAPNPTGEFLVLAARTYNAAGNNRKAEELLTRAIEVAPTQLTVYGLLGALFVIERRLDEAHKQFEESVRRNPKSVPSSTMLGLILEAQGRLPEAEAQYLTVLGISPQAAVAANNLAWLYAASNRNLDQALQLAQTAHQHLPNDPHVSDTLGWVYFQKKMAASAIPHLESSVKKDPNNPVVHYHLGLAYLEVVELAKARAALQLALKLNPKFDGADKAREALASIEK